MKANDILELLRKFHGARTERGDVPTSQAAEILRSGWDAVGYLLAAPTTTPHPESGKETVHGVKRVATDLGEAAEMDAWFQQYRAAGYTALCRFYLKQGKSAMRNSEFKSVVVCRARLSGWEVVAEFIPNFENSRIKPEDFAALAEHIALDWFDTKGAARELAFQASMAKSGVKLTYFNSSSADTEEPDNNNAIGLRGHFGTGGNDVN
ncbi:MAG: hypothetical protein WB558_06960 [Terriglobales bacterium]